MERTSISEAIDITSGNLKYQLQLLVICVLSQLGLSCYISGLSYMLPNNLLGPTATTSFELINKDDSVRSLIINTFYLGVPIGSLAFAWVSDKYGRKRALEQGVFWSAVFLFLASISLTERILLLSSLFLGIFLASGLIGGFLMLIEVTPKKSRVKMTSILLAAWSLGLFFDSIMYTAMVSWRITLASAGLMLVFAYVLLVRFTFESPRYLLVKNHIQEAEEVIKKISCINDCPEFSRNLEIVNKHNITKHSYMLLFNKQTIIASVMFINAISIYYLAFPTRLIFETPYFNGLLIAGLEIFTIILTSNFCNHFPRRKIFIISVSLSRFCLLLLSILQYNGSEDSTLGIIIHIFDKIGSSGELFMVWLYVIEVFPTYVRGMAFGWCIFIGKLGGGSNSTVLSLIKMTGLTPVLILGILTSTSLLAAYFMEETKNRELREMSFKNFEPERSVDISLIKLSI